MATDLATAIRDALHAADIRADQLIQPTLREPSRRRPGRLLAAAAAAVVVVGVAAVAAVLASGAHHGDAGQAGGGSLAGVVGYRWQVTQLVDTVGTAQVAGSFHAQIGFTNDGYVVGDDTVNPLQGTYQAVAGGYTVRDVIVGGVGLAGGDPLQKRIVAAVDGMFGSVATDADQTPPAFTVEVTVDGDSLALQSGNITLTLDRVGPQPNVVPQTPSQTPTKTG